MNKDKIFAARLTQALQIRGMKAVDLAKLTGISKSLISQYQSGLCVAKSENLYLLSNALNVDLGWLIGYDVPMDKETTEHLRLRDAIKEKLHTLDERQLQKVLDYIEDIS